MSTLETIDRLVKRIETGQVLFFIGAGFSIDSEGNTANRLMRRLLVRFQALVNVLGPRLDTNEVRRLPDILRETFQLNKQQDHWDIQFPWQADDDDTRRLRSDISALSSKYFEANEWFCGTFQRLLQLTFDSLMPAESELAAVVSHGGARDFILELNEHENTLLAKIGRNPDPVPFDLIDVRLLAWSKDQQGDPVLDRTQNAGKALFLDTMGFANENIMGGDWLTDQQLVANSYSHKLLPRFHVLGRLAREGMCPSIVTTNYDLLLEGAWRAVGFTCQRAHQKQYIQQQLMPVVPISEMARIGKAAEFFEYGRGNVTANVVKVHGCTLLYREARNQGSLDIDRWLDEPRSVDLSTVSWDAWRKYLPSMVFTYREIQNWRGDSWARDFLATVQRTRTVAFCGYSLQDPVMHDTFRSVYEDMSRQVLRTELSHLQDLKAPDAPAYFWSPAGKSSFYATEVLDSASASLGFHRIERCSHPNALEYQFRNNSDNCFPDLDDYFLLIFHRIMRSAQLKFVHSDLTQVLSSLLNRLVLKREIETFVSRWKSMLHSESELFTNILCDGPTSAPRTGRQARTNQRQFRDTVNWTYGFGSSLLREIAAIELLQRSAGPSLELATIRSQGWYLPSSWNRAATAWGAVVELALKTLFADPKSPQNLAGLATCLPTEATFPTVHVRLVQSDAELSKDAISLQIATNGSQLQRSPSSAERSHYCVEWRLEIDRFPWQVKQNGSRVDSLAPGRMKIISPPTADQLWQLATLAGNVNELRRQLLQQLQIPAILMQKNSLADAS